MILTIIIVSYEVKYFLEQCLFSVVKAAKQLENAEWATEIIVADNASSDGTIEYLQARLPTVHFIACGQNLGFAKANNMALAKATGDIILFLNPDTILSESILCKCISFFQQNNKAGALGVRMIDGSGRFLPESKRGFPTAWRSFSKLSGLSSIFPASKVFAGYSLGHLNEKEIYPIEVIAGAFMMIRKEVLDRIGGFDERFFMYAEDIDLSKRIADAGFINYYMGNETIIHFKGESTSRDKRYVEQFYGAMRLYMMKHYKGKSAGFALTFMNMGIWIRSVIAGWRLHHEVEKETRPSSVHFIGDPAAIEETKAQMTEWKEDPHSKLIILCEGSSFPFADLIQSLGELQTSHKAMIHALGTSCVVGSWKKSGKGITIPLPF
jgi:GT2 family glycosyltransferase